MINLTSLFRYSYSLEGILKCINLNPIVSLFKTIREYYPCILIICLISQFQLNGLAHGELDTRIEAVSNEIQQNPDKDSLYVKRGTLYFQHQDYLKSIRDFEKVEELSGPSTVVYISYAKAWHQLEKLDFALESINEAIALNPENSSSYRLRGRILFDMKEFERAAQDAEQAIRKNTKRITEHYIEYVQALDSINTIEAKHKAIEVLQNGMEDLGELPLFIDKTINLYVKLEDYENAIRTTTTLLNKSNRKERFLLKRAQLYYSNKNLQKSKQDIMSAFKEIDGLPARYAHSKPMKALRLELDALYKKLNLK